MANSPTNIVDFRGFGSSRILISRGGIPRPKGNSPESLSQAILVGIVLVGRLGVLEHDANRDGCMRACLPACLPARLFACVQRRCGREAPWIYILLYVGCITLANMLYID